ncbi:unnamed protein product [Ostreobium quekettii]|uniref:Ricin B lectin domain-containing protein n=1 Tax=Ostreobium quekettii TaxID=121088 RepID=A0A8S1JH12_9CHLO|nr:unnamed protein product [Ostreobium quekettii]
MATPRACLPIVLALLLPLAASAANLTALGDDVLYFTIKAGYNPDYTERCMDAGDDDNVILKPCSGDAVSQLWYISGDTIVNYNSGKCLDVCKGLSCYNFFKGATQVIVYECNDGDNQKWSSDAAALVSAYNDDCLEMCDSSRCDPMYNAITDACDQDDNQQWGFNLADAPEF